MPRPRDVTPATRYVTRGVVEVPRPRDVTSPARVDDLVISYVVSAVHVAYYNYRLTITDRESNDNTIAVEDGPEK